MRSEINSVLPLAVCLMAPPALGATAVSLSLAAGHPTVTTQVSGSGFGANEAVDIYFDTTDEILEFTDGTGNFGPDNLQIPASALPGAHWITALGRKDGDGAHKAFTVRTNWVSHGWNERGQRYNAYENVINTSNVASLDLAWSYPTGAAIFSSPAYAGGTIFVGSEDHSVYALTTAGTLKWKRATGDQVYSSPAVAGTTVYVGSDDGKLYALNTSTGAIRWTATTGGHVRSSPTVAKGGVYVGSWDFSLYAFDASTGAKLWSMPTGNQISASSPAVADGRVYVGSRDSNLYAFDAATGAQLLKVTVGDGIDSSPAVSDGLVYFGSYDKNFYALNARTGSKRWSSTLGAAIVASPAIANGIAYVADNYDDMEAFNASGCGSLTCNPLWDFIVDNAPGFSSAAIANGVLFQGNDNGELNMVDATSGAFLRSAIVGQAVESSPIVADGMVLVGSDDGSLYCYELNGGNNAVYHRDPNPPSYALLHPDYRLKPVRH